MVFTGTVLHVLGMPAARSCRAVYGSRLFLSKPGSRRSALACALLVLLAFVPFAAAEDEAPEVAAISIKGNETFSDGTLKDLIRTRERRFFQFFGRPRYVRDWLRSDLATLEAFYHRAGYFQAQVSSDEETDVRFDPGSYSVKITIHVEEGKRRFLRHLSFEPALRVKETALRKAISLREGEPFDPQAPAIDHFRILRVMQEHGYFSAELRHELDWIESPAYAASDSMDLHYIISEGPKARLGEIRLEGNNLPPGIILREMTLKQGEDLTLGKLLDSKQNLYDTGYFRSVDYRLDRMGLDDAGKIEELALTWILRERRMASLEGGVGVGSVDRLRLLGGWSHRNLLNRGQNVALQARFSYREGAGGLLDLEPSFEHQSIEYRFLRIVRLRATLGLVLFREVDHEQLTGLTSLESRAVRLSAARRLDPHTVMRVREQYQADRLYQKDIDEDLARTVTRSLNLVLDRDTRNHYFSPSRGGQALFSYEIAGGIQGGDHDFHRIHCNLSRHHRFRGGVFAGRVFTGAVWAYGSSREQAPEGAPSDGVPFGKRFYCGGGSTVRGYDENSLGPRLTPEEVAAISDVQDLPVGVESGVKGGRFMLVVNLEWRIPLKNKLGGVFFLDAGNTWLNWREIRGSAALPWQRGDRKDLSRVFYGFGVGLRYETPLTVLRLDVGAPLQAIEYKDGVDTKVINPKPHLHFSLGHTF